MKDPDPTPPPARKRWTFLSVDEMRMLDHWCVHLRRTFRDATPTLVGSALERPDYRDVDIRIPLSDDEWAALPMDPLDLNMLLSQWGQRVTGLPIDCQVQPMAEWHTHDGKRRHPRAALPKWQP